MGIERDRLRAAFAARAQAGMPVSQGENGGLESPPSLGGEESSPPLPPRKRGDKRGPNAGGMKRGPNAGVAMRIRAVGVVVRAKLRACCPNCEALMSEEDALGGRSPGIYPQPPRGTRGYMCPGCAHVEYVRAAPLWRRVGAMLCRPFRA